MPLDERGNLIFAQPSRDGALWGPLLEKAFAKLQGNYENTVSGDPISSIEMLTGAPALRYFHAHHSQNERLFDNYEKYDRYDALEIFSVI